MHEGWSSYTPKFNQNPEEQKNLIALQQNEQGAALESCYGSEERE